MPPFTDLSLQKLKTANLGNIATGLGNAISNLHQQAMDIVYKMPPTDLSLQSLKTANFSNIAAGLGNVISNLQQQAMDVVMMNAKDLLDFFKEPNVTAIALSSTASFITSLIVMANSGFGIHGIGAGTLAAAYQSAFLGNLTPAGSLFAKLQSMGMLGTLLPAQIGIAVAIAALVSSVVWACSEGRE